MSQKKRVIKYLKPDVIKTVSNINKQVVRPTPTKTVTNSKNYQELPISNLISNLPKPKKSRVFIVGGGTSLASFDFSLLEGEDVIAVNKSIEHVPKATYFVTMDYTFITDKSKLTNGDFNIIKNKVDYSYFIINTEHPYIKNIAGVYVDTRMNLRYTALSNFTGVIRSNKTYDISTGFGGDLHTFSHGQNSGYCGVQLALALGYDEIYLLGYDLITGSAKTHFHNGYRQNINIFSKNLINYRSVFAKSLQLSKFSSKIFSCSSISYLNNFIKYVDINTIINRQAAPIKEEIKVIENIEPVPFQSNNIDTDILNLKGDLRDLIVVGYYTINTPYEQEAQGLINSCKKLNLRYDIPGVPTLGNWQSNTRFKAKFMLDMLNKYPGQKIVYVDCDAVIHSRLDLFKDYDYDISVRYQDFRWRKNECLSGTIFIKSNERTIQLCKKWMEINEAEGSNTKNLEQWNLDKAIQDGKRYGLTFKNLPPEYTFIFDSMKAMYPNVRPIIEHFQASRRFRNKV